MHYGELKKCDIANGEGVRVSLFVSGCTNRCKDCFQPQTWDFSYGKPYTGATEAEICAELEKPYVNGLTLLGGDPFEPQNQRALLLIAVRPDLQSKGVNAVVIHEVMKGCFKMGIRWAETGPMLETNQKVQTQWQNFPIEQHKRRRCWVKELHPAPAAAVPAAAAPASEEGN